MSALTRRAAPAALAAFVLIGASGARAAIEVSEVAWEAHRDYWMDHVRVSTDPVLEGDANLDGRVDGSDFAILATNFGAATFPNWAWGDFNQDRRVDGGDFALLAANFGRGTAPGEVTDADWAAVHAFAAAAVPEPGHAVWLLCAGALLRRRPGVSRCSGRVENHAHSN